ncbi:MAG: hypothetical protein QOD74_2235 [Variibacter sp.]|jgi:predicted 3-demethylubiquinone-9 3-methyltransferase (glyoxalase superfamily)|nr:hypothetical protein [Variibacter sp.]
MATFASKAKVSPCLWFNHTAEDAAKFYVSLLPDSRITQVLRSPADNPSTQEGDVLIVTFTLAGQEFMGLNGGPQFSFTEAVSFCIYCDDQAEVDRLWDKLIADGGAPSACGWLKDKFGLSWQIVPKALAELMGSGDADVSRRVMQSMMTMTKMDIAALRKAAEGAQAA